MSHISDLNERTLNLCVLNSSKTACINITKALSVVGAFYIFKILLKCSTYIHHCLKYYFIYRIKQLIVPQNLKYKYGEWAVVTGCTSGVGKSFVLQLAKHGINLVLISRSISKLEQLSKSIEKEFHVSTISIDVDFTNASSKTYEQIEHVLAGKQIGILVNNVGIHYDHPEFFKVLPPQKLFDLINVNITAATLLTRIVLPSMELRHCGAIINMSSSAGVMPNPLITAYSATKSYLDTLSSALQVECVGSGVSVFTLIPFYICTNMTQYSSVLSRPSLFVPNADKYVSHVLPIICQGALGRSLRTTGYWPHTLQLYFSEFASRFIWMRSSFIIHKYMLRNTRNKQT